MASIQKRKQLVNQLRSAHFPFGFQSNKNASSQYVEKYKEYQIQLQEQNKNARKTNFDIKTVDYNNDYVSEFKQKFPQHPPQPKNKQGTNNLEANIVFGYDGNSYDTNYNNDFLKKNGQNERVQPINQRQPHIDFGDSLTDFATTYNQVYNAKQLPKKNVNTMEMRKSNMILGNDAGNFVTQHNAAYKPVSNPNYHIQKRQNINNITLGTDKPNFSSQHSSHFAHKEAPRNVVGKDVILDFKSAHFKFGFPQKPSQNYSEAQAQYSEKPIDFHLAEGNRASSIDMNVDGKNYFNTSYTNDYPLKNGQKANPIKTGQIHNVLLGTDKDPNHFVSQAKQQFSQKAPLPDQPKKFKHPNSLDLGNLPNNYQTHYQDTHTDKFPQRQNCRLTDEQLRRLKDKNFETGFNGRNFGISSASYGSKLGPTNKLPKQVLDGMKNTNIVQGDDTNPFKGNSIYKSSFPWKNNDEF